MEQPAWLKEFISIDEEDWDSFRYREALKPLGRYSLLQQVDGAWPGVTMHNLAQWRAMKYEKHQPWGLWYLIFISAVCHRTSQEGATPQFRRHVMAHLPALSKLRLYDMRIDDERKVFVWAIIGKLYYSEGRWNEAENLFVQVMGTRKRMLGEDHPDTLISMANLASTYKNEGRWKEAEELEVQVMETFKKVLGLEHPVLLDIIGNLATTYRDQGRWKEVEELDMQVLEARLRVLGQEHPDTQMSMNNLALTYQMQGRWEEAKELEVQVMKTKKRMLGQEHLDTLSSIYNLASTYSNQ
jgi:tetratricopeptide (TPR) repeat protein